MSSPSYVATTDHGNGLGDQFGSTTTSSSAVNGTTMMSGDQSSATIIGAMKPYSIPKGEESDSYNDKVNNSVQVSTLPTSSTTSTITSTSNNNSNSNAAFSPAPMGNGGGSGTDDVCRDFLRNMCRRGKSCRYKHPDNEGGGGGGGGDSMMMMSANNAGGPNMGQMGNNNRKQDNFVFCHDFQNRECRRENCRFMHCSKQEEEIFRSTGKLPNNMIGMVPPPPAAMMPQGGGGDGKDINTPVCKDFINGICRRAPGRCKFRHPASNDNYNQSPSPTSSRNSFDGRNGQRGGGVGAPVGNFAMSPMNNSHSLDAYGYGRPHGVPGANMGISPNYGYGNDQFADNGNPNKRKRYDPMPYGVANNAAAAVPYGAGAAYVTEAMNPAVHGYAMHPSAAASAYYGGGGGAGNGGAVGGIGVGGGVRGGGGPMVDGSGRGSFLEEENAALRRRIDDLKKQVSELLSTNEYLMEQINNMRAGPAAAVAVATATSVASLQPPQSSAAATAVGLSSLSASQLTQSLSQLSQAQPCVVSVPPPPPPPGTAVVGTPVAHMGPVPPSSIVSSIASISLPTVSAPVTALVSSSGATSLVSYAPLHSTNAWSLSVDQ